MIVEDEQGGAARAGYGKKTLGELSAALTERFGKDWSIENLTLMRKFYLTYGKVGISYTPFTKSGIHEIVNTIYEIQNFQETNGNLPQT